MKFKVTAAQKKALSTVLKATASPDKQVSLDNMRKLAKALELPLRQGILDGNILDGIFEPIVLQDNATSEFPLHFLAPGEESNFVAYTIPNAGYIPQRHVEGDFVMVPIYNVGNAIDWNIQYAQDVRWDIVGAAFDTYEAGFVKKMNDDGWHTLISAAVDRNIVVLDSDASAGQFTKRLVSLLKTVMRRNGGGNTTSIDRGKLTDLYISPEAMEDIRNWNVDQIDETTRREIFIAEGDNALTRIFGVNLHDLDELGEGQEYQKYYTDTLSATLPTSDVEICVGLDLNRNRSFVMPIREEMQVFEDDTLHRQRREGIYGWSRFGIASLDGRNVLLGSL